MQLKTLICILAITSQLIVHAQIMNMIAKESSHQTSYALELCQYLHKNPELSYQEFETAKRMAEELEKIGFHVTPNFGGNNVVGVYKNGDGPVVLLRTDMDALPVEEKTGIEFASTKKCTTSTGEVVPVMHACGHDIHMAVWIGTLRALVNLKDEWKGTLLVIAQESEEKSGGAEKAIKEGLFQKFPLPDCALAFHINPELASGKIGLVEGPIFAGVKNAEIIVYGKGGHGAYPEKCINPLVIASRIVLDLQTIVNREINVLESLVISVGSIRGGTRPNIIPDEVKLEITMRYYSEEVINKAIASLQSITRSAAQMAGMPDNRLPQVNFYSLETPPLINHKELCGLLTEYAAAAIGSKNVIQVKPAMVGEDFSKYGYTPEKIPICMIWLGSTKQEMLEELQQKGEEPAPLHSPFLRPDYKKTIETGIQVMTGNVIGFMNKDM